jgi:hypothetical protein
MRKHRPTLIKPAKAEGVQKVVAIFRDSAGGESKCRTVYYITPEEALNAFDDTIQQMDPMTADR